MSRNTQGKQSIPSILVLCFLSAWIKALASHSCKLQQEAGEHLAFSKSEVQGCWLLKWNSGIVIRSFLKFYLVAEISTPAQPCECSALVSQAQPWRSSGKSAEALPALQFHAFHSKIIFPCSFPSFPPCHYQHSSTLHFNYNPREKHKGIYVTPVHPKL